MGIPPKPRSRTTFSMAWKLPPNAGAFYDPGGPAKRAKDVISNPAEFDLDGRLHIKPFHVGSPVLFGRVQNCINLYKTNANNN